MIKNIIILLVVCLSGCIVWYDDREYDYHYDSSAIEGFEAVCYKDYGDVYDWYFDAWGAPDLQFVDVYINSWKWVALERDIYGGWYGSLLNTYFYCDNTYDFEVIAEDYYGNVTYRMFYW